MTNRNLKLKKYEFLDHPADLKIRAYGKSLKEVFINMTKGMMEFIYGQGVKKDGGKTEIIMVNGEDQEALLVNWLSEILYLSDTTKRAYFNFKILEFKDHHLKVEAQSKQAKAEDDIKAVTYNELKVYKKDGRWVAEAVFDI